MNKPTTTQEYNELLKGGIYNVTFKKKSDGQTRVLAATLQSQFVPEGTATGSLNEHVVSAFDVQNNGWRSFDIDSVISVEGPVAL